MKNQIQQQKIEITGKILDADMNNEPLPFANVILKGTEIGTTSDFDGNFSYSDIISITNINRNFKIYPNPSTDGSINIENLNSRCRELEKKIASIDAETEKWKIIEREFDMEQQNNIQRQYFLFLIYLN